MEPFLAQIIMFGGNFAPRGWALCDGQLLPIAQNQALFSLLGTTFGGDGRTTFALPDLRGRVSVHPGNGPGLSSRRLGDKGGAETNTLTVANLAAHTHQFNVPGNENSGDTDQPSNAFPAATAEDNYGSTTNAAMGAGTTASTGNGQAVNNMQPFLCVNYIIATIGRFPSRN